MPLDYTAESLVLQNDQIRLLRLLPDNDDSEIATELDVYDFNTCPPYVAISYTWGDVAPTITLLVNGQRFRARMNCWYALWQMRHRDQYTHFWIDSICIDQSNFVEKNVQVARMGKIYQKAFVTACCLGPGRHLSAAQELLGQSWKEVTARDLKDERSSLRTLQQNPYFRRIWIKQELILSRDILVFCGLDCIDWQVYENICSAAWQYETQQSLRNSEEHQHHRPFTDQEHKTIIAERRLRHSIHTQTASRDDTCDSQPFAELWKLLQKFGDSECQIAHDKVYALLPLLSDDLSQRLGMDVAYEKPLFRLCLSLVRGYLREFLHSSKPPHILPISTWLTMMDMIHNWFRLTLLDSNVVEFASQYDFGMEFEQPAHLREHIGCLEYVPVDVVWRSSICGRVNDLLAIYQPINRNEYDGGDVYIYISEVMPFGQAIHYLAALEKRIRARRPKFWGADPACSPVLPPELTIRLVVHHDPYAPYTLGTIYIVPPHVDVGDTVVVCASLRTTTTDVPVDHVEYEQCAEVQDRGGQAECDAVFAPIVRQFVQPHEAPTPAPEAVRFSFLIGWAIQLGTDGTLMKDVEVESWKTRVLGHPYICQRIHDAREHIGTKPFDKFAAGDAVFNFYYEDLILHAILLSDASALLTQPRTHRVHPSFLAEFLVDEGNQDGSLRQV